jgi:solute carrier family 10 (sodium/bile acid cotransporter), member 7
MLPFLVRRWFLLALAAVLGAGLFFSGPLAPLVRYAAGRQGVMVAVMFLMALPLPTSALWQALRAPRAAILATVVNYGLLPLVAWALAAALPLDEGTRFGLLVAATTPCTLASAAVWTQRAGGNDAIAIVVMVATNLLCFVLTPAWLALMLGRLPAFDLPQMVVHLVCLAVLPIVLGQCARLIRPLGDWATNRKRTLAIVVQLGVLSMVLCGSIQTGQRLAGQSFVGLWLDLILLALAAVVAHLAALYAGLGLGRAWRLPEEDAIAVGFAGSQKTLTVGLEICSQLGVTVLPMVAFHVGQLLLDTVVADRLQKPRRVHPDAPAGDTAPSQPPPEPAEEGPRGCGAEGDFPAPVGTRDS